MMMMKKKMMMMLMVKKDAALEFLINTSRKYLNVENFLRFLTTCDIHPKHSTTCDIHPKHSTTCDIHPKHSTTCDIHPKHEGVIRSSLIIQESLYFMCIFERVF